MADHQELFVGIDVGGTSVKEGLFTREGELLGKVSVPRLRWWTRRDTPR